MRALRAVFYGALAACFFAGLFTGRREYFLLFFILAFILLYALALNIWTVFSFSYTQTLESDSLVKGGKNALNIEIHNEKPFPFARIRLEAVGVEAGSSRVFDFSLSHNSHVSFNMPLNSPYRGVYRVGMTSLTVNDSFGLMKTRFDMRSLPYYRQPFVKIYPKTAEPSSLPNNRRDAKSGGAVITENGETYSDLRRYRRGDPLKRVHRAVSARKRELYIKTYEAPYDKSSILIILDNITGKTGEESLYLADLACECAVAAAQYNLKAGYKVTVVSTSGGAAEVIENMRGFRRFYESLAEMEFFDGGEGDFNIGGVKAAQSVYVITARGTTGAGAVFDRARQADITVLSLSMSKTDGARKAENARVIDIAVGDDAAAVLGDRIFVE